jgi:hypothetical protein
MLSAKSCSLLLGGLLSNPCQTIRRKNMQSARPADSKILNISVSRLHERCDSVSCLSVCRVNCYFAPLVDVNFDACVCFHGICGEGLAEILALSRSARRASSLAVHGGLQTRCTRSCFMALRYAATKLVLCIGCIMTRRAHGMSIDAIIANGSFGVVPAPFENRASVLSPRISRLKMRCSSTSASASAGWQQACCFDRLSALVLALKKQLSAGCARLHVGVSARPRVPTHKPPRPCTFPTSPLALAAAACHTKVTSYQMPL